MSDVAPRSPDRSAQQRFGAERRLYSGRIEPGIQTPLRPTQKDTAGQAVRNTDQGRSVEDNPAAWSANHRAKKQTTHAGARAAGAQQHSAHQRVEPEHLVRRIE